MEQLTTLPQLGDRGAMEPWALPAWQCWTQGRGCEPEDASPSIADTPTALQVRGLRSEESSKPEGAHRPAGNTDPEGTDTGLPKLGQQAESHGYSCPQPEDEDAQACKAKSNVGFGVRSNLELLRALGELQQRCTILKEENQMLRKSSFPETEEKVRRLKRKNAELAVIAKRLEERAQKLQETNMRVAILQDDVDSPQVALGEPEKQQRVQQLESELCKKRKKCESLEQEARKKQRRCEELELQLRAAQNENARLVEENSRLSGRATEKEQVEWENAELKGQLLGVKQERDSALRRSQGLQSKLESLEQVLKRMREVAQRRQQLEVEHEQARLSLQEKQEEVRRLQQAQAEAKREHEGAVQLLESTLDSMQARVRELEGQCRSQTERFSLLAQELQAFRLHPGPLDLLTSALGCSVLGDHPPPHCCCSTPQPCHGSGPKDLDLPPGSPGRCTPKSSEPALATLAGVPRRTAKKVDTASEVEELEVDSVSLLPAAPEGNSGGARIQVFLARYSYNPLEGPNENPEAELPLTAGEYIYIYGDMDEDGFFEGELMDGRRGLVPSNFVERVSDDDLLTSLPRELADLSHSSGPELSFLSGGGGGCSSGGQSSGGRSQPRPEEEAAGDELSLSPPPEGLGEPLAVPYPRRLVVLKQLAHSVVLAWELPPEKVDVRGFHIFVNGELRQALGPGVPPKAVLENMDLQAGPLHVSVQALTSRGSSDPLRCCLAVGARAGVVPSQLRIHRLTATSAEITWVPGNSNLAHAIYLNGEECPPARPSTYWATFCHLRPGTLYQARVEAQIPSQGPWEPGWERPEQRAATLQFTTLPAGLPDAPLDVQVEPGPSPGILMISWLPVTIDAAGTSNGVRVTGYTIYADRQKAVETGESRGPDNFGRRGPQRRGARVPRPATTELAPTRSPPEAPAHQNLPVRVFVALFDYDPVSMSPNPDAGEEELPFREGQILKVFGDKDSDGFYRGESGGRTGYIPCNMVAEVAVDSPAGRQQLLQRGFLPPDVLTEVLGDGLSVYPSAHMTGPPPKPRRSKKAELEGPQPCPGPPKLIHSALLKTSRPMVAAFDYNPRENSPNMDVEAELPFRAGDVITVFGNMDDDGFYYGELNGQRGLVPSNFLEGPGPEAGGLESGTSQAESQRTRRRRVQC
ncbi:peripheral-type benzodiazepine receptor-associated protein 1 [Cricetulus griseus]|uniref:Peripheral-type benzodiazepine receptor-associated protein 1 n=1 Tax=Cricetulus griseus TaxID=10029 RepID=A0A061I3H7_CRIGR|nr:peripheral-type benzodiazepine receptor-associated protein 1 [Cricetulus griseus]